MEDNEAYVDQLTTALEQRRRYLESNTLPALREKFQTARGAFSGLYNVLLRKSLVNEDPYRYDQKLSEIVVPETAVFMEHEKSEQLGLRLSQLDSQFEFLITYYQFTTEFLNLTRLKLLARLVKVIDWNRFSESSTHPNTRALADQLAKIRGGSDKFSTQLVNDAQNQMALASREILSLLREVTRYHRESYKLALRNNVLPVAEVDEPAVQAGTEAALTAVKKAFARTMPGSPFYSDLVKEVLREDYLPEGKELRAALLKSLSVQEKAKRETPKASHKPTLLESVRLLATAGSHIEAAMVKMDENSRFVEEQQLRLESPLRRWLSKVLFGAKDERIYVVEFVDVSTAVSKTQELDFDTFYEEGIRTARVLAAHGAKQSQSYAQLRSMGEEEIYRILERNAGKVQKLAKDLPALFTTLQAALPRESRNRLKGIKLELNAIRNSIVKSNQRRHEYIAHKEEETQLRRLGVDAGGKSGG